MRLVNFRCISIMLPLLFTAINLFGQYHDNEWLMGYRGGEISSAYDDFGITRFNFSTGGLTITDDQDISMNFQDTNTAVSDEAGDLLFYYNGVYINNAAHEVMAGGEAINDCGGFDCELGYDMFQGGLVLPDPGDPNRYYLFFGENGFYYIPQLQLVNTGLY